MEGFCIWGWSVTGLSRGLHLFQYIIIYSCVLKYHKYWYLGICIYLSRTAEWGGEFFLPAGIGF